MRHTRRWRLPIVATTALGAGVAAPAGGDRRASGEADVTLRVLVHQNPPSPSSWRRSTSEFEAANPGVTVDMSVVDAARAGDGDPDPADRQRRRRRRHLRLRQRRPAVHERRRPPIWQTLIDAGLLLDLTDQPFVENYDPAAIADAGTYDGRVYAINLGRVVLQRHVRQQGPVRRRRGRGPDDVERAGGRVRGLQGGRQRVHDRRRRGRLADLRRHLRSARRQYPDQARTRRGPVDRDARWNDEQGIELFAKFQIYATEMIEQGATGLAHDAAPAGSPPATWRFMPSGVWQAPALEAAEPAFEWAYIPFPGSDDAADNQYVFGKYDQGWAIAADSPEPGRRPRLPRGVLRTRQLPGVRDAVGFIPTQPTATLDTQARRGASRRTSRTSGSASSGSGCSRPAPGSAPTARRRPRGSSRSTSGTIRSPWPTRPRPTSRPGSAASQLAVGCGSHDATRTRGADRPARRHDTRVATAREDTRSAAAQVGRFPLLLLARVVPVPPDRARTVAGHGVLLLHRRHGHPRRPLHWIGLDNYHEFLFRGRRRARTSPRSGAP